LMGGLFEDEDPFDHPLWRKTVLVAEAPPLPAKGYITCSLAWLARVLPFVRTAEQLVVVQLLYRECLVRSNKTVDLSNVALKAFGISRSTKYRTLNGLAEAGGITIEARNGRAVRVTLHWFP
jgi:hypothetical protein